MDAPIVNIYGPLVDGARVVIGAGNYNATYGLLALTEGRIEIQTRDLDPENVLEFILKIEPLPQSKFQLSLIRAESDPPEYLSLTMQSDHKIMATLSPHRTWFRINYSNMDSGSRAYLLAGTLYALETTWGDQISEVFWPIQDLPPGNLITFLPSSWYEMGAAGCAFETGLPSLVERLQQLQFKGFTTEDWCQNLAHVTNCIGDTICGNCMGPCPDPTQICYQDTETLLFKCGPPADEPTLLTSTITLAQASEPPTTTGDVATVIAVVIVLLIIGLLAWGLMSATSQ